MPRLHPLVVLAAVLLGPAPALANCAETSVEMQALAPSARRGFATLKAGPEAAFIDRLAGDRLYVTPAFEGLPPARKAQLVAGASQALLEGLIAERSQSTDHVGVIASPIHVVDPIGRPLFIDTPCFGSFTLLTEHQRYLAMFSFGYSDETAFRLQTHPLPRRISLQRVKKRFHGVMSWKPAYYIGWVPEGGFFEINLPRKADLKRLAAFWPKAPRGFRYDVRLNDGTLVASIR